MPPPIPIYIAQEFCAIELGNFYAVEWEPITENFYRGQNAEYDSGSTSNFHWWNFTATPRGEIYVPGDPRPVTPQEADDLCDLARNSGDPSTILKVQVDYTMGNAQLRRLRFDIGPGTDVIIPPTFNVKARLLRPVPAAPPDDVVPPGFDPDRFVVADIVLAAKCVTEPFGGTTEASFSTPIFLVDPVASPTRLIAIEEGAVAVSACFSAPPGSPLEFLKIRFDATGAIVDTTVLGTAVPLTPGVDTCFPRTDLPSETNFIRYTEVVAPPGLSGTIVQHLQFL